eukprot:990455-Prymnesium_polylepis.1
MLCSAGSAGSAGCAAGRRCTLAASAAQTPWVHFGPPKSGIVRARAAVSVLVWYRKDAKRMRNTKAVKPYWHTNMHTNNNKEWAEKREETGRA